jgi:hypothetical protein
MQEPSIIKFMKNFIAILFTIQLFVVEITKAQKTDDLLSLVDEKPQKEFTIATFKTTRNINFHTSEVLGKRCLDFRISHRFGNINSGAYNAWGIDGGANIRLGLEYSHDGRLMFGLGRTSTGKIVDGFMKYRLLRQTTGNEMPVSLTLFTSMFYTFERLKVNGDNYYSTATDRMSYCNQIIVARKFNSRFSLELLGAMVHYNLVNKITDKNDCFLVGGVTRFKFTKRQSITLEYAYRINKYSNSTYYDSFGIGYEIETGGHVFQVHLTNSFGLTENQYFMYTGSSWSNMGVRLGFNISRVFALSRNS